VTFCNLDAEQLDEIRQIMATTGLGYYSDVIRAMRQLADEVERMGKEGDVLESLVDVLTHERDDLRSEVQRMQSLLPPIPEVTLTTKKED
jgi:hypothetical protein